MLSGAVRLDKRQQIRGSAGSLANSRNRRHCRESVGGNGTAAEGGSCCPPFDCLHDDEKCLPLFGREPPDGLDIDLRLLRLSLRHQSLVHEDGVIEHCRQHLYVC